MRRHLLTLLVTATILVPVGPARASGDSCEPGWSLDFAAKPGCANIPVLVPGNDTRANLLLLLADRHGAPAPTGPVPRPTLDWPEFRDLFDGKPDAEAPADYASGEGSRCLSNEGGEQAFAAAVNSAEGLGETERRSLVEARAGLRPSCAEATSQAPSEGGAPSVASPQGQAFAAYLRAAKAFYAGRFEEAAAGFADLASNRDPWLSETSTYMVARTALNRMQVGAYDEYGTFKGAAAVDPGRAREAAAGIDGYLDQYPGGRYAASARGLLRRVEWLSGRVEGLTARYAALMAEPPGQRGMTDGALADEFDNKAFPTLTPVQTRDPVVLAVLDLMALRKPSPGETQPPRPDLAAQREAFAAQPDLYGYLEAAFAFYGDNDPRAVIRAIPDDTRRRGGDHLWFSRQFLRGLALEAVGDRNARGFWKELVPGAARPLDRATAELALATNAGNGGAVDELFAGGSPLANPAIRAMLLLHAAGPDLLRARATDGTASPRERQVALYTLLRKELSHGLYADFLSDLPRAPVDAPTDGPVEVDPLGEGVVPLGLFARGKTTGEIGCPTLPDTVASLARDAGDARGRLCLAEWMRLNELDPNRSLARPAKGTLGGGPSGFRERAWARSDLYAAVIADRSAPAEARAYALYRAVKCYEPSGYNACGLKDAPKAERARWYDALKREFPGSRWARGLRYWW